MRMLFLAFLFAVGLGVPLASAPVAAAPASTAAASLAQAAEDLAAVPGPAEMNGAISNESAGVVTVQYRRFGYRGRGYGYRPRYYGRRPYYRRYYRRY